MTISYELTLELKKADFPVPKRWGTVLENCSCGSTKFINGRKVHAAGSDCLLIAPTLSELIEACGDEFGKLERSDWEKGKLEENRWSANGKNISYNFKLVGEGFSPDEAVAKLWLATHK